MVRQSGLADYFEFLISNEDVSRPKPDPEIYAAAIARMGVTPQEIAHRRGRAARRRGGATVGRPCLSGRRISPTWTTSRIRAALDRIETGAHGARRVA